MSSATIAPWITSLSCASPTSGDTLPQWLRFIVLSPCPQRAMLSTIDVLFLLILCVCRDQAPF
ncbi:ABC transporter C family member [Arachis hypogaea]|nr:ABC transporter C family member [Arachis hypogaea]